MHKLNNMGYVQAEIDGNIVIGLQADIDKLLKSRVPPPSSPQAGSPGSPQAGTPGSPQAGSPGSVGSPRGQDLNEDDIEDILNDITNGRKPVRLEKLSDVERSILACLGII